MENYKIIGKIGKGSFGIVSHIRRKSDGKHFVWKEFDYGQMSDKEKQLIVTEVNILRELRHPNIVLYLDRIIDKEKTKLYIIMEHCQGGDLGEYIKKKKQEKTYIDETFIWKIFSQLVSALKECHRHKEGNVVKPILHRDIKPGNVFLSKDNVAKLGDFGLAKELSDAARFTRTNVGTPYYMSPEMVLEEEYDERSDIWALGCLIYEMATLSPPFEATNQMALAMKIRRGTFTPISSKYSMHLSQAINYMLKTDQTSRPYIENLIQWTSSNRWQSSPKQILSSNVPIYPLKELRCLEEKLRRQESELGQQEKQLADRERRCQTKEAELERREKEISLRETRWQTSLQQSNQFSSPGRRLSSPFCCTSYCKKEDDCNKKKKKNNQPSHDDPWREVHGTLDDNNNQEEYSYQRTPKKKQDYISSFEIQEKYIPSPEIQEKIAKYHHRTQYRRQLKSGMTTTDHIFKSLQLHDNNQLLCSESSSESPVSSDSFQSLNDEHFVDLCPDHMLRN